MAANADLAIPEASMAAFESCLSMLLERGMDEAGATKAVKQAFGYGSQLYWRQEKVEAVVEVEVVERAVEYLEGTLGLSADGVVEVAKKFPEALTIDQSLMEENVGKLTDRFKMKGAVLANSIKRKPKVLGATTDCAGDCAGDWYVLVRVGTRTAVRPESLTRATRFARLPVRVALPSSNYRGCVAAWHSRRSSAPVLSQLVVGHTTHFQSVLAPTDFRGVMEPWNDTEVDREGERRARRRADRGCTPASTDTPTQHHFAIPSSQTPQIPPTM